MEIPAKMLCGGKEVRNALANNLTHPEQRSEASALCAAG